MNVRFDFQLDWKFSTGETCVLRFGRGDRFDAMREITRWVDLWHWCTLSEARDAMDLVDAVLDGAADVFAATGDK